jgi:RNA polymerase sigma-70 factor (ECF subfamily)
VSVSERGIARVAGALRRSRERSLSFADVYDELAPSVLRFFARRTRDSELAFDLTAETFAKAFEKRHDFRGDSDSQAAGWIWTIARNELARYHRTRTVELSALHRIGLERPRPSDEELRRVEELTARELARKHVTVAVAGLPAEQQQVMRMRFVDELSYPDIARHLGVSHDVVRARASRAMRTLRASEHVKAAVEVLEP